MGTNQLLFIDFTAFSAIVPICIGLINIDHLSRIGKWLLIYLTLSLVLDYIGRQSFIAKENNLDILFIGYLMKAILIFILVFHINLHKKLNKYLAIGSLISIMIPYWFYSYFNQFELKPIYDSTGYLLNFSLLIISLIYLFDFTFFSDPGSSFETKTNTTFYIIASFFICHGVFAIINLGSIIDVEYGKNFWMVRQSSYLLFNICSAIILWKEVKENQYG